MLSTIQTVIERSIFEVIRKKLVDLGYLPDITNADRYPQPFGVTAQTNWEADLKAVAATKGFAIEVYGHSSSDAKGTKRTPRIVIIPRRSMPGEVGAPAGGITIKEDSIWKKYDVPHQASNIHLDIHLISSTAAQDRTLNAIVARVLGMMRFVTYYNDPTNLFLVKQFNYFDLPDSMEGIQERVYSYEVPDVFEIDEDTFEEVADIQEIIMETTSLELASYISENHEVIGESTPDDPLTITKDDISY